MSASDRPKSKILHVAFCIVLLSALAILTFRQSRAYRDMETLWRATISANPKSAMAHNNLGMLLMQKGALNEAMYYLERATILDPRNAEAHSNFGTALRNQGRFELAIEQFKLAIEVLPNAAIYHSNLANALVETGRTEEAIKHYDLAIAAAPSDAFIANNLAWLLATHAESSPREVQHAIDLAERAVKLAGDNPMVMGTLSAAYAAAGRFEDAIAKAERAHQIALQQKNPRLADLTARMLNSYRAGRAFR